MSAPRQQVDEVEGGSARNHAVEVIGVFLDGFEALSAAGGAAKVVRLVESLLIELFRELLADNDASVEGPIGKILNNLWMLIEGRSRCSIVTVVGANCGEPQAGCVGDIVVLDA